MVTRKQSKEYTRIHTQLMGVYHLKEEMRMVIVALPQRFGKFSDTIEEEHIKRKEMIDFLEEIISPDVPFLEVFLTDLNQFFEKSLLFLSKNAPIHNEVQRTMKALLKVHKVIGTEEVSHADAELMITKLRDRINKIEKKMLKSKVGLTKIQKEFTSLQTRYQYLNN